MSTVQQEAEQVNTEPAPQPIVIPSIAFVLGLEDGRKGVSRYEGYMFFCGYLLTDYMTGHMHGHAIAAHKQQLRQAQPPVSELVELAEPMPAEFAGAVADYQQGVRYCAPSTDWEAIENEAWGG